MISTKSGCHENVPALRRKLDRTQRIDRVRADYRLKSLKRKWDLLEIQGFLRSPITEVCGADLIKSNEGGVWRTKRVKGTNLPERACLE